MVNVAVIGVGNISGCHIAAYKKNPHVNLVAFCDINEKTLARRGEEWGVTSLYTDVDEMLAKEKIDAVSVCTWNAAHAAMTIKALKAGKHVLCEKPMALNVAEAEEMARVAKETGKILMIGFVCRYREATKIAKEFIDGGALGDVYLAEAKYLRRHGNPGGWFCVKEYSGGGPLIDLGVHMIDLVRYLTGKPKAVAVYGATFKKLGTRPGIKDDKGYHPSADAFGGKCDVEDVALADIRLENGAVLHVETSFCLNIEREEEKVAIYGTKGGADLTHELALYTEQNGYLVNTTLATPTPADFSKMFENEIDHFIDCVENGKKPISPAEDGVEIMKIIDAIYRSAESGHEVVIQ